MRQRIIGNRGPRLDGAACKIQNCGGAAVRHIPTCRTGTHIMKTLICVILLLSITACATCKSSDSYEVCRTKQRDHSQARP
jgi:hypothetical protein